MARRKRKGQRLSEAAAGSFQARTAAILRALRASSPDAPYPHVVALFQDPDHVVVERDGKLTRYGYALASDGTAALSGPVLVEETFRTVETAAEAAADAGSLIEAAGPRPGRWKVRAIRSGLSANGNFYPAAALREAVELFSGARVLARSDQDHVAGRDTSVGALIGRLVEPRFAEAAEGGDILATMELIEPEGSIAVKLREAHGRGMADLMGLSIVASGRHRVARLPGGRTVRLVEAIERVDSVDLIVHPSAGGALLELLEAARGAAGTVDDVEDAMCERMKRLIEARLGKARIEAIDGTDDAALEALYWEAVAAEPVPGTGSGTDRAPADASPAGLTAGDVEARIAAATRLTEAALDNLGTEAVTAAIEAERAYLASAVPGGQVTGLGGPARITESRDEKVRKMWDVLLDPTGTSCVSLREAYAETTGDRRVTGQVRDCDAASLREAVGSGTLAEILGDSIARRMIADYRETGIPDAWARFCHAATVTDFRTQRRLRWGGYGDLPEVAERAPYEQLATLGDAEESYAASKRGGTESVTLEAIRNDDLAQLQRLPAKLGLPAKRTLSAFAASFLTANAALADGKASFHLRPVSAGYQKYPAPISVPNDNNPLIKRNFFHSVQAARIHSQDLRKQSVTGVGCLAVTSCQPCRPQLLHLRLGVASSPQPSPGRVSAPWLSRSRPARDRTARSGRTAASCATRRGPSASHPRPSIRPVRTSAAAAATAARTAPARPSPGCAAPPRPAAR